MIILLGVILAGISLFTFVGAAVCQSLIVKHLRAQSPAVAKSLFSKNGVDVNIFNRKFSKYLLIITSEKDRRTRKLKIANLVFLLVSAVSLLVFMIIAAYLDTGSVVVNTFNEGRITLCWYAFQDSRSGW